MNELASKLVAIIESWEGLSDSFSEADLDEMRIMHRYCSREFPDSFNSIFNGFSYTGARSSQQSFIERLRRVLEVESSISPEIRASYSEVSSEVDLIPMFTLNKKDLVRISELCAEMRTIIFVTQDFDAPHRLRLLNRVAAIEAEIHKPKGIFDVIRGGISDLGETLGKFGVDIKPLSDRMSEVVSIARKATKEYDQLPPPEEVQKLPKPEDFEDKSQ